MRSLARARAVGALIAGIGWGMPSAAFAGEATKEASGGAPDVVMLKDGGMLRGTIAELVPDKRVVILLVTGDKRTIAMRDVTYAGPAANAPGASPSAPPEASPPGPAVGAFPDDDGAAEPSDEGTPSKKKKKKKQEASEIEAALTGEEEPGHPTPARKKPASSEATQEVHFDSAEPGRVVYVMTGTATTDIGWRSFTIDAYQVLCTTPCTASLAPGTYRFAAAESSSDKPVASEDTINVSAGDSVHLNYASYSSLRIAGLLIAVGSAIGGLALVFTASEHHDCGGQIGCDPVTLDSGKLYGGIALAGIGGLVGFFMTMKHDEASFSVGGGPVALGGTPRTAEWKGAPALPLAPGLGLSGTF